MTQVGPGQLIDGFLLEVLLGRGAFGEVYRAHRLESPNQKVALKLALTPEGRQLLASEGNLAGRVNHPAAVKVGAVSLDSNPPYLVMEYCSGGNLRQRLEQMGRLSPEETEHLLVQILDCLEAAHGARVAHRDLKPENLLFDADGRLRVADFGLGQLNQETRSLLLSLGAESQAGQAAGTASYMAPEQKRGEGDERVDLFAVGVILFEMLTGKRPELNDKLGDHVDLGEEQARFDRLYQGLCARLERRFQDVASVRAALERPKTTRTLRGDGGLPAEHGTQEEEWGFGLKYAVRTLFWLILAGAMIIGGLNLMMIADRSPGPASYTVPYEIDTDPVEKEHDVTEDQTPTKKTQER